MIYSGHRVPITPKHTLHCRQSGPIALSAACCRQERAEGQAASSRSEVGQWKAMSPRCQIVPDSGARVCIRHPAQLVMYNMSQLGCLQSEKHWIFK